MIELSKIVLLCLATFTTTNAIPRRFRGRSSTFSNVQPVPPIENAIGTETIIRAIHELGIDISFNQWEQGHNGNVVLSPVSIASLMSLILLASRGDSHAELKRTLHYPNNMTDPSIHQTYKKVLDSINHDSTGVKVSMESRIFLLTGLSVLGQFTQMAENSYRSKVQGLNFASSPSNSMNIINDWVETSSRGKITNLISRPFSTDTKFVAANVIYFNGDWEFPFNQRLTENGLFYTGSKNITVPMMTNLMTVPFINGNEIGFDMIALPYKGGKYSMIILSPKTYIGIQSLQRIEYFLEYDLLEALIKRMTTQRVSVKIPRMKLSNKIYLKKTFQSLSTESIFDPQKADLGRLTSQSGIFVNDIVHEAVLEITETGTVAAAASAATFDRIGGNEIFYLDRPSLIFIRDNINGLVLFSARLMKPEII